MPVLFPLNPDNLPMGANIVEDGSGATFRVRAPRAKKVWVRGDFNDWAHNDTSLLHKHGDYQIGYIAGVQPGQKYKFYVEGDLPDAPWKRDPYARELTKVPAHPKSDCVVHDPRSYTWHDGNYHPPYFNDLVIYQLHVGTFNGPDRETRVGTFLDVLGKLDYLVALRVNALLLLPVVEFSSPRSLGYEGADIFSPEQDFCVDETEAANYLGLVNGLRKGVGLGPVNAKFLGFGPHQLKVLVELCHLRGIAVLFDVVYNHSSPEIAGPDGVQSIWNFEQFDMQHDHDSYFWSDQDHNGPCWDIDWKEPCRQYLIDNAVFFVREYHIDGLRYDETTKIVQKNQAYGWKWCQAITGTVRHEKGRAIQIAEHWPEGGGPDPWVVGTQAGHAGFDACYHDGLRRAIRDALRQAAWGNEAEVNVGEIAKYLWPPGFSEGWRCLQHIENHDVVHVKEEDRVAQLAAPGQSRTWWGVSRSRVASALLLTAPGIPMIFMGQEFLEDKRWSDNPPAQGGLLWWHGLDSGQDRAMVNFHRFFEELVRLRLDHPALRGDGLNIFHAWNSTRVIAFHRWIEGGGQDVVIVASLNDHTFPVYELPWPAGGRWREIFNSDAYDDYRPDGNGGWMEAWWHSYDRMPATARLRLPANTLLVFAR